MKKIYFDESGNTGSDLLNNQQRTFILCSNIYTEKESNELLNLFESKDELHFVKLKNSQKGRESIIKLLNHNLISESKIAIYVVHKELATVAQIVDQLIEPVLYAKGLDIYQFGVNIQWTNFIFYFGNFFWDKVVFNKFLNNFIIMFRKKDDESINNFYTSAEQLLYTVDDEYKKLIHPIIVSKNRIKGILDNSDKFTIDVTFSCFLVLCNHWYKILNQKFDVIFDNSKQIVHYNDYIDFIKSLNIPIQEIGFGSRKMTFPAQINSVKLSDSKNELNIQISDIIASSLSFMYNNKNTKHKPFVTQIQNSKILTLENVNMIWPSPNVSAKELNMEDPSGINLLDFLAEQFMKSGK